MSRVASTQPHSPIQRILIFHPTLPEQCMGGKPLAENAGIDEISEQIFFYHQNQRWLEDSTDKKVMEEAVQFLSLCVALYTLPSSLGDDQADKTKEIFFGKATLVFVPLESPQDILAVIQLARNTGGGNPLAVRKSVERCHSLFCMFRGGGITHQLRQQRFTQNTNNCPFPGMDELYSLRKELRKTNVRIARCRKDDTDYAQLIKESEKLGLEIDHMQRRLPIQGIRRDVDAHYKEYLSDMSLVMSRQGGEMRCLVDCIPIPIPRDSGHHTFQSAPSTLNPHVVMNLGLEIRRFLQEDRNQPLLLGISTFHSGHLLYTHSSDGSRFYDSSEKHNSKEISNETICLIMGYMASYRSKMTQLLNAKISPNARSTSQTPLGIKNLGLAFSSMKDYSAQACDNETKSNPHSAEKRLGSFLYPPPPFMLSGLDDCQCYEIRKAQKVWAPRLHIPLFGNLQNHQEETCIDTRVVLYEVKGFSFLLFLDTEMSQMDQSLNQQHATETLINAQERLSAAAIQVAMDASCAQSNTEIEITRWNEAGIDLILVDREQYKLILFSDRDQAVVRGKKNVSPKANPSFQFLGFGPRNGHRHVDRQKHTSTLNSEWSALGLDCRHLLASHLHLDVLLAFDDMMNETAKIWYHSKSSSFENVSSESSGDGFVELCTCMTLGWVYAFVNEEMELYAFFDSSVYVTVADVQNAVNDIKEKHFRDWKNDERKLA
jgi:hypothetical protein